MSCNDFDEKTSASVCEDSNSPVCVDGNDCAVHGVGCCVDCAVGLSGNGECDNNVACQDVSDSDDSDGVCKKVLDNLVSSNDGIDGTVNDELAQILSFARQRYIPVMLDDTRALLYKTVKAAQPKRILEIGTAVGYSGIIMLMASPQATLNTIEMDEGLAALAKQNFVKADVYDRVNVFVGDARQIVLQLTGEYDLIFLDGPKGQYETFLPYLTDVLAVGGTLVCDNVLYKGLVENIPEDKRHKHITVARNMRAFLDDITSNTKFSTTLYRIGDGVTVSKKLC